MGHWNYRIIKKKYKDDKYKEDYFEVHEAYYNKEGKICAITGNPVSPFGTTKKELKDSLKRMLKAFEKPILIDGKIIFAPDDSQDGE